MSDGLLFVLTLVASLAAGLMAGLFFAFSAFVMTALGRMPSDRGIAAMQAINAAVANPLFLAAFFGAAAAGGLAVIAALIGWGESGAGYLFAGGLLYLAGGLGVTILCNLPLNAALAAVEPGSAEGARVWTGYLSRWTAWNHVRTAASLASTAAFILAIWCQARGFAGS